MIYGRCEVASGTTGRKNVVLILSNIDITLTDSITTASYTTEYESISFSCFVSRSTENAVEWLREQRGRLGFWLVSV